MARAQPFVGVVCLFAVVVVVWLRLVSGWSKLKLVRITIGSISRYKLIVAIAGRVKVSSLEAAGDGGQLCAEPAAQLRKLAAGRGLRRLRLRRRAAAVGARERRLASAASFFRGEIPVAGWAAKERDDTRYDRSIS